eukprot:1021627-Amorphochlora_amoeboformis.AAC.1
MEALWHGNLAVTINVSLTKHLHDLLLGQVFSDGMHNSFNIIVVEEPPAVLVKDFERSLDFLLM